MVSRNLFQSGTPDPEDEAPAFGDGGSNGGGGGFDGSREGSTGEVGTTPSGTPDVSTGGTVTFGDPPDRGGTKLSPQANALITELNSLGRLHPDPDIHAAIWQTVFDRIVDIDRAGGGGLFFVTDDEGNLDASTSELLTDFITEARTEVSNAEAERAESEARDLETRRNRQQTDAAKMFYDTFNKVIVRDVAAMANGQVPDVSARQQAQASILLRQLQDANFQDQWYEEFVGWANGQANNFMLEGGDLDGFFRWFETLAPSAFLSSREGDVILDANPALEEFGADADSINSSIQQGLSVALDAAGRSLEAKETFDSFYQSAIATLENQRFNLDTSDSKREILGEVLEALKVIEPQIRRDYARLIASGQEVDLLDFLNQRVPPSITIGLIGNEASGVVVQGSFLDTIRGVLDFQTQEDIAQQQQETLGGIFDQGIRDLTKRLSEADAQQLLLQAPQLRKRFMATDGSTTFTDFIGQQTDFVTRAEGEEEAARQAEQERERRLQEARTGVTGAVLDLGQETITEHPELAGATVSDVFNANAIQRLGELINIDEETGEALSPVTLADIRNALVGPVSVEGADPFSAQEIGQLAGNRGRVTSLLQQIAQQEGVDPSGTITDPALVQRLTRRLGESLTHAQLADQMALQQGGGDTQAAVAAAQARTQPKEPPLPRPQVRRRR